MILFDITDCVKFVAFLLSNIGSMLCSKFVCRLFEYVTVTVAKKKITLLSIRY